MNFLKFLMLLALVLWLGGILFFGAVVAPSAFAVLPTHHEAGNVVTRCLTSLHWIAVVCGVIFLICSATSSYFARGSAELFAPRHLAIVAMLALTFIAQDVIAARLIRMRQEMGVIDELSVSDPRRVDFNRLHKWSTATEEVILVLGLGVLWGQARRLS